jgi:cytochrome c biogenesis protein CcmG/thiol:disulfide interchange protein DsbE
LYIAIITAIAVLGFAVVYPYFKQSGAFPTSSGGPAALSGAPAASYPLRRLDGQTDALANYRGHVVLVNLWASWCEPCRTETPALQRLYEENKGRGLIVLGIDQGEDGQTAAAFARAMKLTYPILLDTDQKYGNAYSGLGLPTTLVVGKDGHVAWGHDGELSFKQMSDAVRPLLGV